jgi:hypothetical protein
MRTFREDGEAVRAGLDRDREVVTRDAWFSHLSIVLFATRALGDIQKTSIDVWFPVVDRC